jgi:hypothetical protein
MKAFIIERTECGNDDWQPFWLEMIFPTRKDALERLRQEGYATIVKRVGTWEYRVSCYERKEK